MSYSDNRLVVSYVTSRLCITDQHDDWMVTAATDGSRVSSECLRRECYIRGCNGCI